ncbi:MAG: hypothetical protein KDJ19_13655 [Hyphomicrobiaceae bacterium]|nr:hypothetical protein [Hyphomicrobiaceae bacterium]MCC0023586.1 hypothetical protein [Hyphomicrobiaceae bacterium]
MSSYRVRSLNTGAAALVRSFVVLGIATAALLLLVGLARADSMIDSYQAYLSSVDHFNSSGARLTSAAQVLQQDRANFHRFGNGDYDDQYDSYFTSVSRRQMMSNMVDRGGMGSAARSAIVNNNVLVWVEIWQGGSGPYVLVSILP